MAKGKRNASGKAAGSLFEGHGQALGRKTKIVGSYQIYTDGSSQPNPGPGTFAVIVTQKGKVLKTIVGGTGQKTTNIRMEMFALKRAMEEAQTYYPATIYTDCRMLANAVNIWQARWILKNYQGIKNADGWRSIFALYNNPDKKITVRWIKAHDGHHFNEMADTLCNQYYQSLQSHFTEHIVFP